MGYILNVTLTINEGTLNRKVLKSPKASTTMHKNWYRDTRSSSAKCRTFQYDHTVQMWSHLSKNFSYRLYGAKGLYQREETVKCSKITYLRSVFLHSCCLFLHFGQPISGVKELHQPLWRIPATSLSVFHSKKIL